MIIIKVIYSVIVPVFNEEKVINESYKRLKEVMDKTDELYELLFVNDGSKDRTADMIFGFHKKDKNVVLLNFSRNFGHQNAVTAGMAYARGDAIIIIDADLQDPPAVMLSMIRKWKEGFDVVYGKREKRNGESFFKIFTAKMYYRFLEKMTSVDIPVDTGDFRLIDRKVCDALNNLPEKNRYVRGLVTWVGFNQTEVMYVRDERFAGETKYPLKKMIKLATDGITSFSYIPLKLAAYVGFLFSLLSFIFIIYVFYQKLFTNSTVSGWASTIAVLLFSQGIVLMILGVVGEYIGRIFEEVKGRPNYIVKEVIRKE